MSERPPHTESELIELVRSIDVRAPEELHRRIEVLVAQRSPQPKPRHGESAPGRLPSSLWRFGGVGAILAAAAVALVFALAGGRSTSVNVDQVSALTLRAATMGAPRENPRRRSELAVRVDGVAFPYWQDRFGWRSTGARTDHLGGRSVTTVFYSYGPTRRIGYAIVAGTPAPAVGGGVVIWRGGASYRLLNENGTKVLTWLRNGHLCVMSGRGVDGPTLLRLASWHDGGTVA